MRLRILSILSVLTLVMGLASIATAHHRDSHTSNDHGMCTAYFSGGENGQGKKRQNGNAFEEFANGIADADGDGDTDAYDIAEYCIDATGGYGNPGGGNDPFFGDSDCGYEDDPTTAEDESQRCQELEDREGGTDPGNNNGNSGNNGNGGAGS